MTNEKDAGSFYDLYKQAAGELLKAMGEAEALQPTGTGKRHS